MSQPGDCRDALFAAELQVTEPPLWAAGGGTWVMGWIAGYRFEALVGAEYAEDPVWELCNSRILKLWIQRMRDRTTVFSWGEGRDCKAVDAEVQRVVDVLVAGLTERVPGT